MKKAAIYGFSGTNLTQEEIDFFKNNDPVGYILFARNCDNPEQIKNLVAELKNISGEDILVLIDQEGGRVRRLKPPHFRDMPSAGIFAELAKIDMEKAKDGVYLNHRLVAEELYAVGINVDCAPMLDLYISGSHEIVGDRSFGDTPEQIVQLAKESCRGLLDGGVLPVIKHIPGHGRAEADSHESLPVVDASHEILSSSDFIPFKQLSDAPIAMTAHIKYTGLDSDNPATLSPKVIPIIRDEIGFDGVLLTDDLSMKALTGDFKERTRNSLAAGCDIVLHCNGDMKEMVEIASAATSLDGKAEQRLQKAFGFLKEPENFDKESAEAKLSDILKTA